MNYPNQSLHASLTFIPGKKLLVSSSWHLFGNLEVTSTKIRYCESFCKQKLPEFSGQTCKVITKLTLSEPPKMSTCVTHQR